MPASMLSASAPSGHSSDAGQPAVGSARPSARPNAWVAAVGIWAVLGLVSLASRSAHDEGAAEPASRLLFHVVHILTLGALTGLVVWISRRTETWRPWSRVGLHIVIATVFAALVGFAGGAALRPATSGSGLPAPLVSFELHFLAYFVVLAIASAIDFVAWRRDHRLEEARLAAR